jgi:hypothetical protein
VEVDNCPKHLAPLNKPSTHSIFIPESQLRLPLCLKGPISLFDSRSPTQYELEHCKWVHLTNDEVWDPHSTEQLQDNEECIENVMHPDDYERCIYALNGRTNPFLDITNLLEDSQILKTMHTDIRKPETPPESLAMRWGIGLEAARNTIKVTTQRGVHNTTFPIEQRFRTKQQALCYPHLGGRHGRFYTDTFFSSIPSLRQCKAGQLYTNDINFMKIYPIMNKSETHDTLHTFIH